MQAEQAIFMKALSKCVADICFGTLHIDRHNFLPSSSQHRFNVLAFGIQNKHASTQYMAKLQSFFPKFPSDYQMLNYVK